MQVAIGLPSTIPGARGDEIVEWARAAEEREFSSLATIDRIVYPNYEPLISLAAAAAVTEQIGLLTSVLLGPLRANVALLAKQTASVSGLSDGRFTLGIGLGGRADDYEASGLEMRARGKRLDSILERIQETWPGSEIGPDATPRVVLGGHAPESFRRAARFGEGWIGGRPPDRFAAMLDELSAAWEEAGREGEPRRMVRPSAGRSPRSRMRAATSWCCSRALAIPHRWACSPTCSATSYEAEAALRLEAVGGLRGGALSEPRAVASRPLGHSPAAPTARRSLLLLAGSATLRPVGRSRRSRHRRTSVETISRISSAIDSAPRSH